MSLDKKSASGRILKEEILERESCREAVSNLGEPDDRPEKIRPVPTDATRSIRKETISHSISKAAHERGLAKDIQNEND